MSLAEIRQALTSLDETLSRGELSALLRDEPSREALRKLRERVQRDLLPRLRLGNEDAPALVVGIAGPNNVGKSSLFNALAGAQVSPARAEGGLTKQCLAACHESLNDERLRAYLSQRYEVIAVPTGEAAPVDQPGPSGRLFLVSSPSMPRALLVLDTPDFDSLYRGNRVNAEALLVTVDLVLFVVSKQTYQNAALVDFLKDAIGHGRPWAVLYNEATKLEVAKGHLDKLSKDVGYAPIARFFAPHQPLVEEGRELLRTEPLDGEVSLAKLLSDETNVAKLKARALSAALADARTELSVLRDAANDGASDPARLAARIRYELRQLSSRAALKAVPADVLVEAFRDELDARSATHRWIRMPFRGLATALSFVGRQVRKSFAAEP
ncbi:MAG: GTPase, partial [Myxococcaceae bacterium]